MNRSRSLPLLFSALCLLVPAIASLSHASTGGFLDGGIKGEYFANDGLSGQPAFERRDIRLNFDWGSASPAGNPFEPGFRNVKGGKFSVRWTGRLLSTLGGETTFTIDSNAGARLFLKPEGSASWVPVVEAWSKAGPQSGTFALEKGKPVEIRVEYHTSTSPAHFRLWWESAERPRGIIESAFPVAMNHTASEQTFADAVKSGRWKWENVDDSPAEVDENGWPKGDAALIVSEYFAPFDPSPLEIGLNRMSFRGDGNLSVSGNYKLVEDSIQYDAKTKTTTADLIVDKIGSNVQTVTIRNSARADGTPGFTDLKIMRPVKPGAQETFDPARIFHPDLLEAYSRLGAIRFQRVNDQTRTWEERIRPGFFSSKGKELPYVYKDRYGFDLMGSTGMSHEYEILLCNSTGKNYYVTVPHLATVKEKNSYIHNLARLIKYGSDGKNPYKSPQANPVYPPLNPNLNVDIEEGNELWNFAALATYAPFFDFMNVVKDMIEKNDPDFAILNYDNLPAEKKSDGGYDNLYTWVRRYWALYLKQISDAFREEFGDDAMPGGANPRIRPYFTWQYANTNETAVIGLDFMDKYFNNAGGEFVKNPKPVNHYFYGAGGAGYYSVLNKDGYVEGGVPNGGFEKDGAGWTFTGTAGIVQAGGQVNGESAPPEAMEGTKLAYLQGGNGGASLATIRIPVPADSKSPVYGLQFRWASMGEERPRMKVSANGVDIIPRGANDQPRPFDATNKWKRVNWWVGNYYFSETFEVPAGQVAEITFSTDPESEMSGLVFLDDIRLTSISAFYSGGLGSGAAMGQTEDPYEKNMKGDANWANAYGLVMCSYEHGYSAGGDAGNSPLQDYAKFVADEARLSVVEALDIFQREGGYMPTFGTYSTWPLGDYVNGVLTEGTANSGDWPLAKGIDQVLAGAPQPIQNGTTIPAVLGLQNLSLGHRNNRLSLSDRGAWVSFNLVAPSRMSQEIIVLTSGTGRVRVDVNGREVVTGDAGSPLTAGPMDFAPGLHGVRVLALSGGVNVDQVIVAAPGTSKTRPALTLGGGDASIEASWDAIPGVTGYRLAFGKSPGGPYETIELGNVTKHTLRGLANNTDYFATLTAIGSDGAPTLPSQEKSARPVSEDAVTELAVWDFSGQAGNEESVDPTMSNARIKVSPLQRGPGLKPRESTDGFGNTSISEASDNNPPLKADEAAGTDEYYEITIAPVEGAGLSLATFRAFPFFQNAEPPDSSCGLVLSYSVGNAGFESLAAIEGVASSNASEFLFNLEKVPALQGVKSPVTLRLHLFGNKAYEFMGFGKVGDHQSGNDIEITGSVKSAR